jgi:hypothetical protein
MSYEDIEDAQAKRTKKEDIKSKKQRGWKRKSAVLEAGESESEPEPEPEPEVARMIEAPWRAPVAQMC